MVGCFGKPQYRESVFQMKYSIVLLETYVKSTYCNKAAIQHALWVMRYFIVMCFISLMWWRHVKATLLPCLRPLRSADRTGVVPSERGQCEDTLAMQAQEKHCIWTLLQKCSEIYIRYYNLYTAYRVPIKHSLSHYRNMTLKITLKNIATLKHLWNHTE